MNASYWHSAIQTILIGYEYANKRISDEKYNSKSAALYRDKIATEAQGNVSIFMVFDDPLQKNI